MYHYVKDSDFLKQAYSKCKQYMITLGLLLKEVGTESTIFHIGPFAKRNMVTQNDNGPVDFNFTLQIDKSPLMDDCEALKLLVKAKLFKVLNIENIEEIIDSRYELSTGIMHLEEYPNIDFKIHICIIFYQYDNNENYYQLVHYEESKDNYNGYEWQEIINSKHLSYNVISLKSSKLWSEVKENYLSIKNLSLLPYMISCSTYEIYVRAIKGTINKHRIETICIQREKE